MPDPAFARRNTGRASAGKRLAVSIIDEQGRPVSVPGLAVWLARIAPARARGAVNVAIVSDQRVRALNKTYRRKDYATDVLSFPISSPVSSSASPVSSVVESFLGEIVIARGVAKRQARDAGHSEYAELRVLALHGLLHLLGYDHEIDAGRMRRLEQRLRRKGGLDAGLIERAETKPRGRA